MKRLDLVAGPNGAGKSTFVALTLAPLLPGIVFVNADEIAKQRWPDDPTSHAYQAAHFDHALAAYYLILPSEVSSNLARFDAMRYGLRVGDDGTRSAEEVMAMTRAAGFGPEVKRRIMIGTYALSAGYYDAYYNQAQKVRTLIARDLDAAYRSVDVLVSPTTPTTAFRLGEKVDDPLAMYLFDLCTLPLNLAGHCGMSVPSGLSPDDGLPVGLQIMAPALADDRLYRVGAAYEAARGPLLSAI